MKLINVHGIKMSAVEEMAFGKYLANNNVAMNTKTKDERMAFTMNWLAGHLGTPKSMVSGLLNRKA